MTSKDKDTYPIKLIKKTRDINTDNNDKITDKEILKEYVIDTLKQIYDPELPANIYDLGLIYNVETTDKGHVVIDMTLTTPNCPVAETFPLMVQDRVSKVSGVNEVKVNIVWDPPWSPDNLSDEVKLELGLL